MEKFSGSESIFLQHIFQKLFVITAESINRQNAGLESQISENREEHSEMLQNKCILTFPNLLKLLFSYNRKQKIPVAGLLRASYN